MGKYINPACQDAELNAVSAANRMIALAGQPADYATAIANTLAYVAMAAGDYTLSTPSVGLRRVTTAAKPGVSVATGGTADHVAFVNTATSALLLVTPAATAQVLTAGLTVDFAAITHDNGPIA